MEVEIWMTNKPLASEDEEEEYNEEEVQDWYIGTVFVKMDKLFNEENKSSDQFSIRYSFTEIYASERFQNKKIVSQAPPCYLSVYCNLISFGEYSIPDENTDLRKLKASPYKDNPRRIDFIDRIEELKHKNNELGDISDLLDKQNLQHRVQIDKMTSLQKDYEKKIEFLNEENLRQSEEISFLRNQLLLLQKERVCDSGSLDKPQQIESMLVEHLEDIKKYKK